jgi:hypothetical protein
MRNLTLGDLKLGLNDLLEKRSADLKSCQAGALYGPMLTAKRDAINGLPEALTGGRPLAAQLAEADVWHDGYGGAVWHLTEAILRHPDLPANLVEAAERVREAFIPSLGVLKETYADQAAAAKENRPSLKELGDELKAIDVPGGKTLHTWVSAFLKAGDNLDKLLSDRAMTGAEAGEGAKDTAGLRSATIGMLGRFRAAVADEVGSNAKLPKNLDGRLFGYFDELSQARAKQGKAVKGAKAGEGAEPGGSGE